MCPRIDMTDTAREKLGCYLNMIRFCVSLTGGNQSRAGEQPASRAQADSPTRSNLFITPRSCPMMLQMAKKAMAAHPSSYVSTSSCSPPGSLAQQPHMASKQDVVENPTHVFTKSAKPVISGSREIGQRRAAKHAGMELILNLELVHRAAFAPSC